MTMEDHGQLPEKDDLGQKSEEPEAKKKRSHHGEFSAAKSWAASLLFSGAVMGGLGLLTLEPSAPWTQWVWLVFVGAVALLIMRTGRVSRWRAVFFVALALGFIVEFKAALVGLTGGAFVTDKVQEVPYCHIAIASSVLNSAYSQYLAVKSGAWREWGPLSLGFLWVFLTLALGQAWCSWVCWYGGLDDGFSRLLGRFRLRRFTIPAPFRDLPAGILLFFIVISMTSLLPMFCLWACPLKLTTGFLDPIDAVRQVQLAIFVILAAGTLVLGPMLTGKRVFCGMVCPFGAWQAFWGRINPFRVTLAPDRCTRCRLCAWACPTFSIEPSPAGAPKILPYCNRCGECLDVCPTGALSYTLLDRQPSPAKARTPLAGLWEVRSLLVWCGLVLGGAVGGLFVPPALARLVAALFGGAA